MTLKPMYPAIVNSPGTELAADITATATEITVLSSNGLPPAPNLLTLGSDETAETVRYTKVEETKLTVERGFQGVAKSWSAGTRVARYFTAYDHDTFRENIEAIDAETSGAEHADLTLNVGLQVVESAQDTPFQFEEIRGSTRINLNGKDGNFDYRGLLPTFFGTGEIVSSSGPVGTKAMKVVCNRTDTAHFGARYELEIDRSKHYIAVAYMDNVSCDAPVYFSIAEMKDAGYTSLRLSAKIAKGSGMQYLYATISPTQMENREKLVYYFRGEGTSGNEFRIGPFAFYEITAAEYDAIAKMTPEQVAARYPYVDSMTNVMNLYAIVTGGNLLPPFTEWGTSMNSATYYIANQYEVTIHSTDADRSSLFYADISVIENTDYSLSCDHNAWIGVYRTDGSTAISPYTQDSTIHFNSGNEQAIRLYFSKRALPVGSYTFKNPMLTIGTEPKPFVPQQRSMLAFEAELAAHPVDGSNPDTLFMGDDGLPYVLEPWGKVTLDGSLSYLYSQKNASVKQISFPLSDAVRQTKGTLFAIKYDGKLLIDGGPTAWQDGGYLPDYMNVWSDGYLYLSIANTDSGWGPDYKPELDEIKAYFLGWKMYDATGADYNDPTGGMAKWWQKSDGKGGRVSGTQVSTVPTTLVTDTDWHPYRLQYLKAKPTVEPVRNYELGATLSAGSNMVEVGSGIVIRERVYPSVNIGWGHAVINRVDGHNGHLKNRAKKMYDIYRNTKTDTTWEYLNSAQEPYAYGLSAARTEVQYFDPTAVYHVTYTMLDPTLAAPFSGTVAANLRGTVSDLVQDVGDVQRRLSVSEVRLNSITSDLNSPLDWITATLLNGWKSVSGRPVQYAKDALGFVHFRGALDSGEAAKAVGTDIFILPVSYRPPRIMGVPTVTYGSPQDIQAYAIDVGNGGSVRVTMENTRRFVHLETLSFYAGGGTT